VDFSADYLDYMAEFARRYEGEIIQSDRRRKYPALQDAHRRDPGFCPGIPFFLIVRKVAPALVTGNTIVIKPAARRPTMPLSLPSWWRNRRCPGRVQSRVGLGNGGWRALAAHPKVGMVSLTGSVAAVQR